MWLPSAASLQLDYAITQKILVNATIVQGIPIGRNGGRRVNLLGLTPRFESRWLGVAIPITYYNFDQLRYGLAGRFGPFFMGTDDLGNLVSKSDLNGADFYFGIKINPILFGGNKGGGFGGKNGPSRGAGRCPQF